MVRIETIKNGPYIVKGEVELIDADGNKFPVEPRMALCRCGASTEKPFCDGTHSKIGFKAAEKAVPESKEEMRRFGICTCLLISASALAFSQPVPQTMK